MFFFFQLSRQDAKIFSRVNMYFGECVIIWRKKSPVIIMTPGVIKHNYDKDYIQNWEKIFTKIYLPGSFTCPVK